MKTEDFFKVLLSLDANWQVQEVEAYKDSEDVEITIKYIGKEVLCNDTYDRFPIYDFAPERGWRHLDILQYKAHLKCRLPRMKNKEGKVVTISPPWASKHERFTHDFESYVIDLLLATKNQTKTAKLVRCGFNVVNRVLHRSVARGMARRQMSDLKFDNLSIDEKAFRKGHSYITVLSYPSSGCIIDVEEHRTKSAVRTLIDKSLTHEQQQMVETISMDMWKPYITVANEKLPNAGIVHDRFHLVKYLNDGIDKVRRREVKTSVDLKDSRYALLKNPENLTEKQRIKFETIKQANYQVSKAWQIRENFKDLFQQETNPINALKLMLSWASDSISKQIKEMNKVVETFKTHISGVLNALTSTYSNAMAERLNGKIQELKTVGRGYRTFKNFRSAILFFNGGLSLYPLN